MAGNRPPSRPNYGTMNPAGEASVSNEENAFSVNFSPEEVQELNQQLAEQLSPENRRNALRRALLYIENRLIDPNTLAEVRQEALEIERNAELSPMGQRALASLDLLINTTGALTFPATARWMSLGFPNSYGAASRTLNILQPFLLAGAFGLNAASFRSSGANQVNRRVLAVGSGVNVFYWTLTLMINSILDKDDLQGRQFNLSNAAFWGGLVVPGAIAGTIDTYMNVRMSGLEQRLYSRRSNLFLAIHAGLEIATTASTLYSLALYTADQFFNFDSQSNMQHDEHVAQKFWIMIGALVVATISEVLLVLSRIAPDRFLNFAADVVYAANIYESSVFSQYPEFLQVIYEIVGPLIVAASVVLGPVLVQTAERMDLDAEQNDSDYVRVNVEEVSDEDEEELNVINRELPEVSDLPEVEELPESIRSKVEGDLPEVEELPESVRPIAEDDLPKVEEISESFFKKEDTKVSSGHSLFKASSTKGSPLAERSKAKQKSIDEETVSKEKIKSSSRSLPSIPPIFANPESPKDKHKNESKKDSRHSSPRGKK